MLYIQCTYTLDLPVRRQEVANVVGDGLCIRGRPGATGVYVVVQRGDLITHAVGHVRSRRRPRVCSHDDSAVVLDGHDRRLSSSEAGARVSEENRNRVVFVHKTSAPPNPAAENHNKTSNLSYSIDVACKEPEMPT